MIQIRRFSQDDLLRHSRAALTFWEYRDRRQPFRVEARVDLSTHPTDAAMLVFPPQIEIWAPAVLASEEIESYVKDQAAFWDVFNQLLRADTELHRGLR